MVLYDRPLIRRMLWPHADEYVDEILRQDGVDDLAGLRRRLPWQHVVAVFGHKDNMIAMLLEGVTILTAWR
jgi:hypothetical protein